VGRRGGKLGFTRQPTKFWCSSSVTWWGSGPAVRVLLVPEIGSCDSSTGRRVFLVHAVALITAIPRSLDMRLDKRFISAVAETFPLALGAGFC